MNSDFIMYFNWRISKINFYTCFTFFLINRDHFHSWAMLGTSDSTFYIYESRREVRTFTIWPWDMGLKLILVDFSGRWLFDNVVLAYCSFGKCLETILWVKLHRWNHSEVIDMLERNWVCWPCSKKKKIDHARLRAQSQKLTIICLV